MNTKSLVLIAGLMTATATTVAWAAKDADNIANRLMGRSDSALVQSVEGKQIVPLESVVARVRNDQPGTIVEVELERDDGRLRYEIEVVDAGGRVHKLVYDAITIEPLVRGEKR
ncbi:MAG: hypothetical protein DWQ09_13515 [Proteobacteria bacterium]|nr:MAG: hypothetical protein DWQ09_13515 [Pseudomonadota bacterium]QKK12468.1 MAG: hypothetical protein HND59_13620 [Pseudomonadota bacterium]